MGSKITDDHELLAQAWQAANDKAARVGVDRVGALPPGILLTARSRGRIPGASGRVPDRCGVFLRSMVPKPSLPRSLRCKFRPVRWNVERSYLFN